jgi:hypothetical protein
MVRKCGLLDRAARREVSGLPAGADVLGGLAHRGSPVPLSAVRRCGNVREQKAGSLDHFTGAQHD